MDDPPKGNTKADEPDPSAQPEGPTVLGRLREAPVTYAIIAINVAVFAWADQIGIKTSTLLRFGAVDPGLVWAGEYWRVVSYMFMHGGWMHVAMNSYGAISLSAGLERAMGTRRFVLLYVLSGIGGGCACLIFQPALTVGASGAIFGLLGAMLAIRRKQLGSMRAFFADPGTRGVLINVAIWMAIITFALKGHVSHGAHAGGLLVGAAVTWLLVSKNPRSGWVAFAVVFIAMFVNAIHPWAPPKGEHAQILAGYAQGYLEGKNWPSDPPRGERLAERGCNGGIARACLVLAEHLDKKGDPATTARAEALHRRTCELDTALCAQIR